MKIDVVREPSPTPPIKEVTLTLTPAEAMFLYRGARARAGLGEIRLSDKWATENFLEDLAKVLEREAF